MKAAIDTQLPDAERAAARLPPLLVRAWQVAETALPGAHGRRRAGPGESFWQFRDYQPGEPAQRIDWRRSARTDHVVVREKEWVSAHSVWLWPDPSPSMRYASRRDLPEKADRAALLMLALAVLLTRAGEAVALAGDERPPMTGRAGLIRLAESLERQRERAEVSQDTAGVPPAVALPRHGHLVIAGDFLGPMEDILSCLGRFASRGLCGHLVQVLDPAEETLPFRGRVRFEGLEAEGEALIERTEAVRGDYQRRLAARRETVSATALRLGWSFTLHHTDRPTSEALLALHGAMSAGRRP